ALTGDAARISLPADTGATVEVLLHHETLAELGLPEGPLTIVDDGGRPLPVPDARFVVDVSAGRTAGWTAQPGLGARLEALRIDVGDSGCAHFEVRVLKLPTAADGTFAITIDDERALLGTDDGRYFLVDRTGRISGVQVEPAVTAYAAARGEHGDLWFGGQSGAFHRGDLGDRLTLTPMRRAPSGGTLHWFDAASGPDGLELYALTLGGSLERFRLGQWVSLFEFGEGTPGIWSGGVARLGPGEALAGWPRGSMLARAIGDRAEPQGLELLSSITAIGNVPGVGVIAASSNGTFAVRRGESWEELKGSELRLIPTVITPYEDGFVYGGAVGNFGQWRPSTGYCPLTQPAPHWITYIAPMGEDLLLFGSNETYPESPVTLLHRVR
ncbi:hypothetical protein L6R52_42225, partial [Myxococcota bacterium]|nr:hypothetical protein [Myxococcota bacterium]